MLSQKNMGRDEKPKNGWIEKLGWAGFLFFFVKGMLWLLIPVFLIVLGMD
ncbi:MAG: hypothetical protein OEW89_11975 [Gammaproteobacteria bacterium]|nr:hypothetical protein [Gammaproteobacteria bacterium]MDH5592847.1 hypothetical protein [Gammaproteobacteria bacterium]MDH5614232.1 hypothetical protein [Gammaproteobacteria bacterium]